MATNPITGATDTGTVMFTMIQPRTGTSTAILRTAADFVPAIIIVQGDVPGQVFRLKSGANTIGRGPDCDIRFPNRSVSSLHAKIERSGTTATITDLDSTNGTSLKGAFIDECKTLTAGDLVKVGSCVFKYEDARIEVELAETLHAKGTTDQLTGASNKHHLLNSLASSIEIARIGYPLSLVILDLDHFKKVNDTYGHLAGDHVLKETCQLLRRDIVRKEDLLGRFGGEEFVLILPDIELSAAISVAERIRTGIEKHVYEFEGTKIPVTASLGVCQWKPDFQNPAAFLALADALLYKSKHDGRNRVTAP